MKQGIFTSSAVVALLAGLAFAAPARADDAPAPPAHPMLGPVQFSGHIEGGTSINPDNPDNNTNFGQLFTDRSNSFRVNQALLTAEKDLDPAATGLDWGFKAQFMYGTDSRYTHTFGLFDRATNSPYQVDFTELNGQAHLPVVFSGGVDVKAGIYSTPIGYEVIDATGNFFYTHSYIFNFGIPLKHTGIQTVSHINDMIDVWAGVDTGVNSGAPFFRATDNNSSAAFLGGIGINNPIPNLTILALAHIGAENGYVRGAISTPAGRNRHVRQIYDVVTTYKLTDAITLANESNFIKDDLAPGLTPGHGGATAEGTAFYGIYKMSDQFSFGARAEVFRDDQGFFVSAFQSNAAAINAQRGITTTLGVNNGSYNAGKATYSALTFGVNYTPAITLPGTLGLVIRPEARWDHAFGMVNGAKAFDVTKTSGAQTPVAGALQGTKNDQFLLSIDAILSF
jgi:hypothetical protein